MDGDEADVNMVDDEDGECKEVVNNMPCSEEEKKTTQNNGKVKGRLRNHQDLNP